MAISENKSGSGQPIATGALVLLILGAFAMSTKMAGDANEKSDALLAKAAEYLLEKPYLAVDPRLEAFAGSEAIAKKRSQFWLAQDRRGAPPIANGLRDRRQQILDEKVARATQPLEGLPDRVWGLRSSESSAPSFLLHAFIHTKFLHLAINALLFCWLGILLERVWGGATLLGFSLCAAMVSGGVFVLINRDLDASLIGYSGVVAAALGAYLVNAANAGRGSNYVLTLILAGGLLILPSLLGRLLGQEWSIEPVATDAVFGPSQWSILGGAIFGMVAAPAIWLVTLNSGRAASGLTKRDVAAKRLLDRAATVAANGQKAKSVALIKQAVLQSPTDREVVLNVWRVARTIGLEKNASGLMLTAIRDELRTGEQASATQHWLELLEANPDVQAESGLLVRLAPLLHRQDRTEEAVSTLEIALRVADPAMAPEVASSVALAARDFDPDLARRASQRALKFDYLDPERRSTLEQVMAQLPAGAASPQPARDQSSDADGFDAAEVPTGAGPALDAAVEATLKPEASTPDVQSADEMWELDDLADSASEVEGSAPEASPRSAEPQRAVDAAGVSRVDAIDLDLTDEVEDLSSVLELDAWSATLSSNPAAREASRAPAASKPPEPQLNVSAAIPTGITPDCLHVEVAGMGKRSIDLHEVDAIATGLVYGLAPSPVVVIDLALNWSAGGREPLRIARLRTDQFDARQIMNVDLSEDDALREMLKHLLAIARPATLPDPMSVSGLPFAEFANLDEYERTVLARQEGVEPELL